MTIKELLNGVEGITEELLGKIEARMKEKKQFLTAEENADFRIQKLKEQRDEANKLLDEMKKSSKTSEEDKKKIAEYEKKVEELQKSLDKERMENGIRNALTDAKGTDIDYLAYKLRSKGDLELDENGKVKGLDKLVADLKTELPSYFESASGEGKKTDGKTEKKPNTINLNDSKEKNSAGGEVTKEQFVKMGYQQRLALKISNPDLYKSFTETKEN